jgi:hypothetical protein
MTPRRGLDCQKQGKASCPLRTAASRAQGSRGPDGGIVRVCPKKRGMDPADQFAKRCSLVWFRFEVAASEFKNDLLWICSPCLDFLTQKNLCCNARWWFQQPVSGARCAVNFLGPDRWIVDRPKFRSDRSSEKRIQEDVVANSESIHVSDGDCFASAVANQVVFEAYFFWRPPPSTDADGTV